MKPSFSKYSFVASIVATTLVLVCCKSQTSVVAPAIVSMQQVKMDGTADATLDSIITFYRNDINKLMMRNIGICDDILEANRPEGGLSRMAADVVLFEAIKVCNELGNQPPVIALLNNGGLRTSLPKGNVTVQNIFEISPFENSLVIITLNAQQLQAMFEHIAQRGGEPISGATLTISNGKAKEITIDGKPIDNNAQYIIATNSYLAAGGDGFRILQECEQYDTGLMVRDLMIEYVEMLSKQNKHIADPGNIRIKVEDNE